MLSSVSDSSADRIDATDAGGAYNDELLVIIFKEAEDLLDLIFAREDLGPVILEALDIVKALLDDLRLAFLQWAEDVHILEFLILASLVGNQELVRLTMRTVTLTAALQIEHVLASYTAFKWLLKVTWIVSML